MKQRPRSLTSQVRPQPQPHNRIRHAVNTTIKSFASVEHLGPEAIAAFVDEEMSRAAMHRARVHLVQCAECRAEVEAQRAAALKLRSTADTDTFSIPPELLHRLAHIADCCPEGPGAEETCARSERGLLDKVDHIYRAFRRTQKGTGTL